MKISINKNQSGASAIMFAMVFIIVISLLSLGFATLARKDQRATLDKNLSSEAQLVAESGVNSVVSYVKAKGTSAKPNSDCNPTNEVTTDGFVNPSFGADGPKITCITWDTTPNEAVKTLAPYETWSFVDELSTGNNEITITADTATNGGYGSTGRLTGLPGLVSGKLPIIKVAEVSGTDITNTTNAKVEVFYLVPANNNNDATTSVNLNDGTGAVTDKNTNGNGSAYGINCSNKNICKVSIVGYPTPENASNRMYFFQVIGDVPATLTYTNFDSMTGKSAELKGIQTKVDVNAQAQDQSKRLVSYISMQQQTWQPWFAALSNGLCKDIKVDGNNNAGIIQSNSCPTN
jgi:Tfp pilus assembly protein PilX